MPAKQPKATPLLESLSGRQLLVQHGGEALFAASITYIEAHERSDDLLASNDNARAAANDDDFWGDPNDPDDWLHYYRPYTVIEGVLQIPIMGVLLDRFPWQLGRWATGYKYIEMALKRGLADPMVRAIALISDSPGGEVTGCFELADKIYAARSEKPIRAFAANHAYSAAYALTSAAQEIVVTRSGGVGSIGVVTMHVSYQDALTKAGIKVTFIVSDPSKVEGNYYEDLTASAKKRIQARINKIYGVFSSTVAKHRGMDEEKVIDLKAYTYDADEAIENGLANRIGALDEELVIYTTEVNEDGDEFMATPAQGNVTGQKPGNGDGQGIDQATYDKGVTDAKAEGKAEGVTEGMNAQKERISGILASDEGQKRPAAALHCALNSDMSVDQASKFLAGLAVETKPNATAEEPKPNATNGKAGDKANRNHFAEHMNNSSNPDVGSGDEKEDDDNDSDKASKGILDTLAYATGAGKNKAESGRSRARSPFDRNRG